MAKTLDTLKSEFQLLLSDKSNGTIETADQTELFNQALRTLQTTSDVYGTIVESDLDVFAKEFEYPAPANFKATIDILDRDNSSFHFDSRSAKIFYRRSDLETNVFSFNFNRETQFILVNAESTTGAIVLHDMDSLTDNGAWAAVGGSGASNLTEDTFEKREGTASINFDATAATVPAIQNLTFSAVDLSDHEDKSTIFVWVYLPTITNLTSIGLRWGDDTTIDYWEQTVTTQFSTADLQVGWNRVGFGWNTATEVGTPDSATVNAARVTITYSLAITDTDFRVDEITSKLPKRLTHSYYTEPMVKTTAGAYTDEFVNGDDITVLLEAHDDLLVFKALERGFMILQEFDSAQFYAQQYEFFLQQIMTDFNSQRERQTDFYYNQTTHRLRRGIHFR